MIITQLNECNVYIIPSSKYCFQSDDSYIIFGKLNINRVHKLAQELESVSCNGKHSINISDESFIANSTTFINKPSALRLTK